MEVVRAVKNKIRDGLTRVPLTFGKEGLWWLARVLAIFVASIRPGLIWYASLVQIVMGGLLAFGPQEAQDATAASAVVSFFGGGGQLAGSMLILAAILALVGLYRYRRPRFGGLALSLLQQSTLIISSLGSFTAVINSRYADGVPRPWAFIANDQSPYMLAVILYTIAVVGHHILGPLVDSRELQKVAEGEPRP